MPSSPTEQPAWVQIFEYATQPSSAPASTVRAVSSSGGTRSSDHLGVVDADESLGEHGDELVERRARRAAIGWPSLVTSRRPAAHVGPGPLAARLRPRASRSARRIRPPCWRTIRRTARRAAAPCRPSASSCRPRRGSPRVRQRSVRSGSRCCTASLVEIEELRPRHEPEPDAAEAQRRARCRAGRRCCPTSSRRRRAPRRSVPTMNDTIAAR